MHISIHPEFGRTHPLWSDGDNGTDIHVYPFSEALLERIMAWNQYWDDHYLPFHQVGDSFIQGWVADADVSDWIQEGNRISDAMKREVPGLEIEKQFLKIGDSSED